MTFLRSSIIYLLILWPIFGMAAELPPPTIAVSPDVYYHLDEILYLEGRARPNSNVQIQFQKQGAKPVKFNVKSDPNGEWVLAEKAPLEPGDWEVRARILARGGGVEEITSEWSNPRVFKVIQSGITIGGVNIKFAALALAILALLVAGGLTLIYFLARTSELKAALFRKEIREAKESVREGLSEIRRDLLDELRLLETQGKALTSAEIARKEHILRELDQLERNMDREISDIEKRT